LTNKSVIFDLIEPELNNFTYSALRRVEGVSNQFLDVIDSNSDLTFDPTPSKMGWEMCASEVLLQSRFGFVCDWKGDPLVYDSKRHSPRFWSGVVAARSMNIFNDLTYSYRRKTREDLKDL
jgi:hypothetical protein